MGLAGLYNGPVAINRRAPSCPGSPLARQPGERRSGQGRSAAVIVCLAVKVPLQRGAHLGARGRPEEHDDPVVVVADEDPDEEPSDALDRLGQATSGRSAHAYC